MFARTTAIDKLLRLHKRKRVVQGGTWAGKTYGIIACIIEELTLNPHTHYTVVAETIPALKKGALKDFIGIMIETSRWLDSSYNGTDRSYRFANGSYIEFNSFDSIGKAQSAGKRNGLFINEAPYVPYEIADSLMVRTDGNIWIDFNPTSEFWAHTEILKEKESEFLLLKYTDNEALPKSIHDELLLKIEKSKTSEYWRNWCKVYIDGELGVLQGVVFENWNEVEQVPATAKLVAYGLDFGYTNDPSACVGVYIFNNEYYLDEVMYSTGMLNDDIFTQLKPIVGSEVVYADAAEPKSIEELRRKGLNVLACVKGSDSVMYGINLLQEKKLNVTKKSINLKNELRYYTWMVDKNGAKMNKPIDNHNHAIDAIRYAVTSKEKFRANYI
jgi:phage terminase large subunit